MPKQPRPKSNAQNRRMFGLAAPLAAKCGMDAKEYIEQTLGALVPRPSSLSISKLTFDQANAVIKTLGGDPFPAYGNSKRNQNYRKQQAGIKSIETEAQLTFIRELAAQRNMTDDGLDRLATRMRLPWPPNTTEQGNKLCEALKAMIKRDNVAQFPVRTGNGSDRVPATAEPTFRRVA